MVCLLGILLSATAYAAISTAESKRLGEASTVLSELRSTPEKGIPDNIWNSAECVMVFPSVKKAAFIVGGEYGKGVASCRGTTGWSAPLFMQIQKGSFGAQVGAQEADLVLLVMNKGGMEKLVQDKVSLGAGASIAAGPVGRDAQAATDVKLRAEILSYSRARGVFAGIDLTGGVLGPDKDSNTDAYGASVAPRQVLVEHTVTSPPESAAFLAALRSGATGPVPTATSGRD
jgi:lipid-binding SYLF domain-containing protein